MTNRTSFQQPPSAINQSVFSYLEFQDQHQAATVCKNWKHDLLQSNIPLSYTRSQRIRQLLVKQPEITRVEVPSLQPPPTLHWTHSHRSSMAWDNIPHSVYTFQFFESIGAPLLWEFTIELGSDSVAKSYGMIGANEKFVVFAMACTIGLFPDIEIRFYLFDRKTGKIIGKFSEDFSHLPNTLENALHLDKNSSKVAWLQGDFLAVWVGKQIKIWHIPSQKQIGLLSLETVCSADELDDSDPFHAPVHQVEIRDDAILLTLAKKTNPPEWHLVQFSSKAADDLAAIKRFQSLEPVSMDADRTPWEQITHTVSTLAKGVFSFFRS